MVSLIQTQPSFLQVVDQHKTFSNVDQITINKPFFVETKLTSRKG
jgi:hypothetical protein